MNNVPGGDLLLFPLLVVQEQDPGCCCEEEHQGHGPDAETDDGSLVGAWVGMNRYRSLNLTPRVRGGGNGDSRSD